jgi:hypothetical protein
MWPWEHAAVAYLAYSLMVHVVRRRRPAGWPVLALLVGSQLPDLVDKPLEWVFAVLPSSGLAHSVLVAVPVVALGLLLGARLDRLGPALAFGLGWLSHLPGDVFYPVLLGSQPAYERVLWPLVPSRVDPDVDLLATLARYFDRYADYLLSPAGAPYLVAELALLLGALILWLLDGRPGLDVGRRLLARLVGRPSRAPSREG